MKPARVIVVVPEFAHVAESLTSVLRIWKRDRWDVLVILTHCVQEPWFSLIVLVFTADAAGIGAWWSECVRHRILTVLGVAER